MKKKIIIINGSCRQGGNTDKLVQNFEKGAQNTNAEISKYILRNESINNCIGCYYCYDNPRCSIKDDMQKVHNDLQNSDLIVLASPMYWWGVTGLMKTFIDRLYLYYPKNNAHLVHGKKLVIMVPMNVNQEQHGLAVYQSEIEPLQMTSGYIFKRLGIEVLDIIFYPGLNDKESIKKHEEHLANAYRLGKTIETLV
jgi:multimeric flavodoxin WrbA